MEDDKLKNLFSSFSPSMPCTDEEFMKRLEDKMTSFDAVKQQIEQSRHRAYRAAILSVLAGFVVGVSLSFFLHLIQPGVNDWFRTLRISANLQADFYPYIGWLLIAASSTLTVVFSYNRFRNNTSDL